MAHIQYLLLTISVFLLLGCAPEMDDVIQEWRDKGWDKVSTLGVVDKFNRHSLLMSEKAQAIEASWIVNGKRKTKLYDQETYHFLVLRFFCKNNDEFAVVMRKRK
jgi:hypothetical protein